MGLAVSADNKLLREMPKHAGPQAPQRPQGRLRRRPGAHPAPHRARRRRHPLLRRLVAEQGDAAWRARAAGKEHLGIDLNAVDDLNAIFGNPTPGQTKP